MAPTREHIWLSSETGFVKCIYMMLTTGIWRKAIILGKMPRDIAKTETDGLVKMNSVAYLCCAYKQPNDSKHMPKMQ
jgi:hypothetical protein